MKIEWDTLPPDAWYAIYNTIPKSNLIQTFAYAKAMRKVHYQYTRFGHILNDQGKTLGLVQMQEIKFLGGLIHRIFIDRGPLWCATTPNPKHIQSFWSLINVQFPRRFGRKRRFIPECDINALPDNADTLKRVSDGYETYWLDLRPDIETLRQNLNKKWRNTLKKSESENLNIERLEGVGSLEVLLYHYMQDRKQKGYSGASPKVLRALHNAQSAYEYGAVYSTQTSIKSVDIAMMYIYIHGTSATYQIGWNTPQGRDVNAHYAMLWRVIIDLKARGIDWLDLGGINPDTAKGVTRFKKGLNGVHFKSCGIFS